MIECDDRHLEMLLNAEEDSSGSEEIAAHVDSCPHCQTRLATLVADADEWQDMKKWLSTDDRLAQNEDQERWRNGQRPGNRAAWTDSMARQLLAPPSHPEMLGRIGRYEVERLIGAGGMGIVFKAYDSELNRPVAIKVLAPYLAGNGSARKRFGREARAAAAVVDEHVVAIHNVESDGESPFLVMQYVAGESLHARIDRSGPLDLLEILRIGMQTAKGLAAAHAQGLIHRDVKPSNILLEETVDRALLTDFGLARAADDASLTHSGYHPGTPQYMSPEQSRGEAVDPRSDLFSLGCVMYAMCTGHSPFRAETTMGVLRRISDEPHRPVRQVTPHIPPWLEAIIDRLLAKDRSERFQSAEEVAETLGQWLAHAHRPDVIPAPANPKTTLSNPAGGKRGLLKCLMAAAASLLLLFAGIVIVLETGKGTIRIESEVKDVPIRITRGDEIVDRLTVSQDGKSIRVSAGQYVIQFDGDVSGLSIADEMVTLQRGATEVARIVQSGAPGQPAIARPQATDAVETIAADKITVDIFGGSDVLTQMNKRGSNRLAQKHNKLLLALNAIQEVTTNFRETGAGQDIRMVIVRDPSLLCRKESQRTGKTSKLKAAINTALRSAGIDTVRWEEGLRQVDSNVTPNAGSKFDVDNGATQGKSLMQDAQPKIRKDIADQQEGEGDPPTTSPAARRLWREPPPVKQRGFGVAFNQYANNRQVSPGSEGLTHVVKSSNFVVRAATREQATAFSNLAEAQLAKLMDQWLGPGVELPPYYVAPPELLVRISSEPSGGGDSAADGSSTHIYLNVPREQMEYVQSHVLSQPIMGLILTAYFDRNPPYWAEVGLLSMLQDEAVQKRVMKEAEMNRREGVLLPLREFLTQQPDDYTKLLVWSRQSLSFMNFLKARRGQKQLLPFLRDGHGDGGWAGALKVHYGFNSVEECESAWLKSIAGQSPSLPENSGMEDGVGSSGNSMR